MTPSQVLQTIEQYESVIPDSDGRVATLQDVCRANSLSVGVLLELVRRYPEIADRYVRAQQVHAEQLAISSMVIADNERQDSIQGTTKDGRVYRKPNNVKVRRDELRIKTRQWFAGKLHPDRFADQSRHREERVSLNASVNMDVSVDDLMEMSFADLMKTQKAMRQDPNSSQTKK